MSIYVYVCESRWLSAELMNWIKDVVVEFVVVHYREKKGN